MTLSAQLSTVLGCGSAGELPENPGEMLAGGEAAILRYLGDTSVRIFQQHLGMFYPGLIQGFMNGSANLPAKQLSQASPRNSGLARQSFQRPALAEPRLEQVQGARSGRVHTGICRSSVPIGAGSDNLHEQSIHA